MWIIHLRVLILALTAAAVDVVAVVAATATDSAEVL